MKKTRILFLPIILLLIWHFLFIFLPPYMKDELYYYLALPHLWKIIGTVKPFFWFLPSHFPPLFMWIYYIISPEHYILSHLIGFSSTIMFLFFLYIFFKKFYREQFPTNFLVGSIIFLTIPVIFQISGTAYVGIWVATFTMGYIYFLYSYIEREKYYYLLLASLMMALSVATKYTGLTVSVILGILSLPLLKTKKQLLLFLVTLPLTVILINLPWLIMNYRDTGNPIFPLLGKFFTWKRVYHYNPAAITFSTYINPIAERRLIYRENWIQILSAPIRVFFYGREGNPALFDGALSPLLLIFIPFIGKKGWQKNKVLIISASIYIIVTFFSTPLRARYLIPVIPLLMIPSLDGLIQLYNRNKIIVFIMLIAALIIPVNSMINRTYHTNILQYITGKVSEKTWKEKHILYYKAYAWTEIAPCRKIFLYFNGRRGYYINKPFMFEPSKNVEGSWLYYAFIHHTLSPFRRYGVDCLFISKPFFRIFLKNNFTQQQLSKFSLFFENHSVLIYNDNLVAIWKLKK